jgi:PAS domain S-box-containing protein
VTAQGFIKKLKLNGLRSQLIVGIASILVVLMSLLVMELMNRQKNFFLKLNHDRAFGLSSTLASTANSYVVSYELAGLQKLVATYKNNPGLQYAIVLSDDGVVLAHTDEKYLGQQAIDSISERLKPIKATQTLIETQSILDIAAPIIDHDKIVGWARIGLSQEYIEPNLSAIRKNGFLFILISLIVGSLFAILIAGRLSSGLQKLVTAAEKIKGGNRDLRVEPTNSFETAQLGTAFNQMLDEISTNEKMLSMVLENMPVGIWILDEKGKIISANPAGQEMWKGVKYVGMDEYNIYKGWFTETGKELGAHEWGAAIALKEGRPILDQEIEIECFDKSHKIILNSAIPLRDTNEKIIGAIALNVDITERKNVEDKLRKINHAIGERVKELNCLYKLSELSNDPLTTIEDILKACVNIIPPSYQYPDITCARILFNGQIFQSADFCETAWKQEATIIGKDVNAGKVEVFYKEQVEEEDEGPFLKEERMLVNSIAEIIGSSAEKRMSERKLKESEERSRALVENIADGIVLVNAEREIIYQSPSVERIHGFSFEDRQVARSLSADALIYEEDKIGYNDFLQEVYNNPGVPMQSQVRMVHKDGKVIWTEGSMVNMLNNENVRSIIINYRDITERKKATELFKYQFENSPDIILIINKDLKIESINRSRSNTYSPAELIGKDSIEMLPEESRENAREMIRLCFETGKNQEIENTLSDKRWVRSRFVPIIVDREITHIMIIATEITERKLAEERTKQSEANYRQLFDNSPAPMWIINENTSAIIGVNQACIRNYGYSEEEFLRMAITDISPDKPSFISKENMAGLFFMGQQKHVKKSGELIDVVTSSIPVKLNEEKSILLIAIDVTEKNQYEQKLTKAAIKVQEDERYEIGGELHDNVCQLLAGSLMFLGVIKRSLPEQSMEMYDKTHQTISLATDEIRNLSHRLAPAFFDKETLEEVLIRLLETFNVGNKYTTSLTVDDQIKERSLNHDLQLNLYRILQEQLRNIMKHAKATDILL